MNISSWSALENEIPLENPNINKIKNIDELESASKKIKECYRLLNKGGQNIVGEILKGQGTFYQMSHYPQDDVYDSETHSQYYYHNHRGMDQEHGHFHTFLRAQSIPDHIKPMEGYQRSEPWPLGDNALAHFIGISMDDEGFPIGLFATNRWVTDQTWYSAEDTIALLDNFCIDHAFPNLVVNQWITAFFVLFRPHIVALLEHRDKIIAAAEEKNPNDDILENRELEITGAFSITPEEWVKQLF